MVRKIIAELLECSPDNVRWARDVAKGNQRYDYYTARNLDGKKVFVKVNCNPERQLNIQREAIGSQVAERLGVDVKRGVLLKGPGVWSYYAEQYGMSFVAFEYLDGREWKFLSTNEEIAGLTGHRLKRVARAATCFIRQFSGHVATCSNWPDVFRKEEKADWRNRSPEHLDKVWAECEVVYDRLENVFPHDTKTHAYGLRCLMEECQLTIRTYCAMEEQFGRYYLLHGDFGPRCLALSRVKDTQKVFDFEEMGLTRYQFLAQLADVSNFWGRCWPNHELQRQIVEALWGCGWTLQTRRLLECSIVFGTLYLAKYAMEPSHPEHGMARTLLLNLPESLRALRELT